MGLQVLMVIHTLPLWFLVFSLFLPRVALLVLWLDGGTSAFQMHGLLPLLVAILLPRVMVLYLIYLDQGVGLWFVIHLVAAVLTWGGSGGYYKRRRRYREN
ncbi:MAG TPA: hypothetical protein VGU46_04370 [Acidobacteriaceae bacterium]|nr:hypothetical protein [Acidobacteriaceae bacterium]